MNSALFSFGILSIQLIHYLLGYSLYTLFYAVMPDNCSIYGCPVSRKQKYKGIGLYKVPGGNTSFDINWKKKLIDVVVRDRVVDGDLKERISKGRIFILLSLH